ncbi:hypothetical protein EYV94_22760 [Puteibacter caeruleilacunae]|nr:hypothetical protein EYV94_22760 [Puteibacter caeruleilacunae]
MVKKIIIWVVAVLGVGITMYVIVFIIELSSTRLEIIEVKYPQLEETIYLKNEKRGLNYEKIAISTSSKEIGNNEDKSFIYKNGETIFYKAVSDTLVVYTMNKIGYPRKFNSKVYIKQIEITNPKFIELRNEYKELGLSKFPK